MEESRPHRELRERFNIPETFAGVEEYQKGDRVVFGGRAGTVVGFSQMRVKTITIAFDDKAGMAEPEETYVWDDVGREIHPESEAPAALSSSLDLPIDPADFLKQINAQIRRGKAVDWNRVEALWRGLIQRYRGVMTLAQLRAQQPGFQKAIGLMVRIALEAPSDSSLEGDAGPLLPRVAAELNELFKAILSEQRNRYLDESDPAIVALRADVARWVEKAVQNEEERLGRQDTGQRLRAGRGAIRPPFAAVWAIERLQAEFPQQEIAAVAFNGNHLIVSVDGFDRAYPRLEDFGRSVLHTHKFNVELKASPEDTENARALAKRKIRDFILTFDYANGAPFLLEYDPRKDSLDADPAEVDPWTLHTDYHQIQGILRNAGFVTFSAGLEEPTAAEVANVLSMLGTGTEHQRTQASESLRVWSSRFPDAVFLENQAGVLIDALIQNLFYSEEGVRWAAQETLTAFAQGKIAVDALGSSVPQLVQNLFYSEEGVRWSAQRTLTAFAQGKIAVDALGSSVPQLVQNLFYYEEGLGLRWAAEGTLAAFAALDALRRRMEAAGLTPARLGFPVGMDWNAVARLERVNQALSSLAGYGELTLGGRALLRRKLVRRLVSDSEEALRGFGENWLAHEVRLEGLDRSAGLASSGAELHLPVEGSTEPLERLASQLANGAGVHSMVPWILEAKGRQIDIRLLPAYPGVFRRFLAELLKDEALAGYSVVGAHYSVGLDLGKELVPVALALYYGDENYLVAPVAGSAEGGVGFPGVWTYRGQSLDMKTGQVTDQNQSNLHLRPLRTFAGEIPLDLFQGDVDRLNWFAAAAAAPEGDPKRQLYGEFIREWERWVERQGGAELMGTIRMAEREVESKSGAGVSPALDKASADLLAAMVETPEKGTADRSELALILKETLEDLEAASWGSAAAAKAIQVYRESEGLADLDRTLAVAVGVVTQEIFSAGKGSLQEKRLLKTLEALDPEKAEQVRASLQPKGSPQTGLEEMGAAARVFAEQAKKEGDVRIVLGQTAFQVPGLGAAVNALREAGLKDRFIVLPGLSPDAPEDRLPDEVEDQLYNLGVEVLSLANPFLKGYADENDRVMKGFQDALQGFRVPFQRYVSSDLTLMVRQILLDLGVPEATATTEAVDRFLALGGLEEAA